MKIYAPNAKAPIFIKEALLKFKTLMKPHTLIVREFSKPVPPLDRTTRQKFNKETKEKNRSYDPIMFNRQLYNMPSKHKSIYLLLNYTWNILQN